MPFWLRLLILYILVALGLAYVAGLNWRLAFDLLLIAAGLTPAIVRHSPRAWLATRRVRYWITNANTSWHVNLSFNGSFTEAQLQEFAKATAAADRATRVLENNGSRVLLHYRRLFVIELAVRPSWPTAGVEDSQRAPYGTLSFTLLDQHVGYRRSKRVLEEDLVPLVEKLKEATTPKSGHYAMRIGFEGTNPFLGMYLQQLRAAEVRGFEVEVTTSGAPKEDYFRVTLKELVVNAGSLEGFRRNALTGLTFGAMGA